MIAHGMTTGSRWSPGSNPRDHAVRIERGTFGRTLCGREGVAHDNPPRPFDPAAPWACERCKRSHAKTEGRAEG